MRRLVEFLALLVFDTTPSTCCVCHPSVAGFGMVWQTQSRAGSTLGFSCSQLQLRSSMWCRSQSLSILDHRCHCNCRDLVLFVGRHVLRECLRRDVVWWWFYCRWYLRFCLGQCEAGDWKFFLLFPVPRVRWVYLHAEFLVQQQRRDLRRQLLLYPVQVDGHLTQCEVGVVSVRRYDHQGGPC